MSSLRNILLTLTTVLATVWSANSQQLVTTSAAPYNSVPYLVNNVLMGNGVQGYNITSYGASIQRGFFSSGGTAIGIDSGLVMCSGNVTNIMTSTGAWASTAIPNGTGQGAGDSDLLSVAQSVPSLIGQSFSVNSTWDASIIEFDFVSLSDTVEFSYVFGSDEYTTWINTSYNDVFGLFLSGPGISGSYSNSAINVATVPGTNPALPISISTIHPGLNSSYYNSGGSLHAYNGYTDVMTAVLYVSSCDTFHMKLGVADGSDKILDTGVFLEDGSFATAGLIVQPSPSYNPFGADTALYEGCGDVKIFFTRSDSVLPAATLSYKVWGDAEMGTDYSNIINSQNQPCTWNGSLNLWECEVYFAQSVTTDSIAFEVYADGLTEGVEDLVIAVDDSIQLGCHSGDTIELSVIDPPTLDINAFGDITIDCHDDSVQIGVNANDGLPPFDFEWSNGAQSLSDFDSTDTITVMPTITSSYVVTVTDGCGVQQQIDYVNVSVFNVPWSSVKIGDNQTISCIDPPVDLAVGVVFNDGIWHGDISYLWSTGSTDSTINVFSVVDTTFTVTITRGCTQEQIVHDFTLNTYNDPVITKTFDVPESDFDCPGDIQDIKVSTSGGYVPYSFSWSNGALDSTTSVGPVLTKTYYVTIHDICALVDYVDSVVVNVPIADPLVIDGIVNDTLPCPNLKAHFGPAVPSGGYGWGFKFSWDNWATVNDYTQKIVSGDEEFTIELTDGCLTDTVSKTVSAIIAVKNDLELYVSNDTLICFGDEIILEAEAVFGGGEYEFVWNTGDNRSRIKISPTELTTYNIRLTDQCDTVRMADVVVDVSQVNADFDYEYIGDYDLKVHNNSMSTDSFAAHEWIIEGANVSSLEFDPVLALPDGNPYSVELTSTNIHGCVDIATVIVAPEFHLYIPTGFTPNNDNLNDRWTISSVGIREMKLQVFDRWGGKLFETTDKSFEWDGSVNGKRAPMGAYAWRIVLYTDKGEYVERRGSLNLMNDFQER